MIPSSLRLPIRTDARRLREDLAQIVESDHLPHFNRGCYRGEWTVVPLRSIGGQSDQIYPDPTRIADYTDTPLLARCPYVREVLDSLEFPLQAVRFLRLRPGSEIKTHRDLRLGFKDGEIRLHFPITTNPDVDFIVDGQRWVMGEGECWYHDFTLPHSVINRGPTDRVHLVVDGAVNDWVSQLLHQAAPREAFID